MIIRRTYPELLENHIQPLCSMLHVYDQPGKFARYNDSKKHITFPNGSRILFRYCEKDKDAERFQGIEVDVLFIDEATHQSEERVKKLNACIRGVNNFPKRVYYTCNPGGEGHAWVKRLFIDKRYKAGEKPEEYEFIQSLVLDNKALMDAQPEYVEQLKSLPPKLRDAWLYGRWDIFEGQVFEEFTDDPEHYHDRLWTHVIEPFKVPETWRIYRGFDWGYTKPFSCAWYAVDHDGRIYRIREYYGCQKDMSTHESIPNEGLKMTAGEVAEGIRQIEAADPNLQGKTIIGIADPAIFDKSTGVSIAEEMEKHRVYWEPGDHTRIAGKMQCHYRLAFDEHGVPMFYVFSDCTDFIRTIPTLIYDERKVEDINTEQEDHIYDEWRYVMMENPISARPQIPEAAAVPKWDPLDLYKDKIEEMKAQNSFWASM